MKTNLFAELTDIVFSEEVQELAAETSKILYCGENPFSRILANISSLELFCSIYEDFAHFPNREDKRESLKKDIQKRTEELKAAGITNDDEARKFLERVAPTLTWIAGEIKILDEQHRQEREELISSFQKYLEDGIEDN